MKQIETKTSLHQITETPVHESTYALLVRSEEKERGLFEAVVYALFVGCTVMSLWQFAQQSITIPTRINTSDFAIVTASQIANRS